MAPCMPRYACPARPSCPTLSSGHSSCYSGCTVPPLPAQAELRAMPVCCDGGWARAFALRAQRDFSPCGSHRCCAGEGQEGEGKSHRCSVQLLCAAKVLLRCAATRQLGWELWTRRRTGAAAGGRHKQPAMYAVHLWHDCPSHNPAGARCQKDLLFRPCATHRRRRSRRRRRQPSARAPALRAAPPRSDLVLVCKMPGLQDACAALRSSRCGFLAAASLQLAPPACHALLAPITPTSASCMRNPHRWLHAEPTALCRLQNPTAVCRLQNPTICVSLACFACLPQKAKKEAESEEEPESEVRFVVNRYSHRT